MSNPKTVDVPADQARKAFRLMVAAGGMFVLAGVAPIIISLVRGQEVSATGFVFMPIGMMFIVIAAATYDKARKAEAARSQPGPKGSSAEDPT